jgi:3-dehydroquinate synthase
MKTVIPVPLPDSPYDIVVANQGLTQVGSWLANSEKPLVKPGQRVLLVSNPAIFRHYGQTVMESLTQAGYAVQYHLLPAGERYKTLKSIQALYDAALEFRLERQSAMVALGGGVIGDMTGFAAATWLRGMRFVQIPTSLLAMVDASIGGKTGVNHPQGKNLIGAFHQPRLVVIDPMVLKTLPPREFRAGMAEVIKYGVIGDAALFADLEAAASRDPSGALASLGAITPQLLQTLLERSASTKARVVAADEREGGLRAILNYGHTLGHVVETLCGYGTVLHGEAVALGMLAAGEISCDMGLWGPQEQQRQKALIAAAGLPLKMPKLESNAVLACLQGDKKVKAGKLRFVLPTGISQVVIRDDVPAELILAAMAKLE